MSEFLLTSPNEEEFELFRQLIEAELGIHLSINKRTMLGNRLWKRVELTESESFQHYYEFINRPENADEKNTALELVTTNETFFFREEKCFDYLQTEFLPNKLLNKPIRVWSAACSTGEEAYSIAMTLDDCCKAPWEIVATDFNLSVLSQAREAIYLDQRTEKIPPRFRKKYFMQGINEYHGHIQVKSDIRNKVSYYQCNLLDDFSGLGKFDVIFLRNVLIYFNLQRKEEIIQRIVKQMNDDAVLFTGHSESLHGMSQNLKCVRPAVYIKNT